MSRYDSVFKNIKNRLDSIMNGMSSPEKGLF